MSDLELTKEEQDYVMRAAHNSDTAWSYWAYYASFIVPMVVFCLYGLVRCDVIAEFIAFGGLLLFFMVRISRDAKRVGVHKAFFRKVANHERNNGA
jgi:hypothetical protein